MQIYVLRHGETDYNAEGKFQGRINTTLNTNGIEHSIQTRKKLKNIKFDIVISSPLTRALQTADIVTTTPPILDNRIIERSFGTLEGKHSIANYEDNLEKYNIETFEQLCERIYDFLDDIIKKYKSENNILIVTHACVAQVIETYFNKNQNKENWGNFHLKNSMYKIYEIGG